MQSEGDFQVKADIPGVPKEAIKVNVDNNILTVSVQQENKTEDEQEEAVSLIPNSGGHSLLQFQGLLSLSHGVALTSS